MTSWNRFEKIAQSQNYPVTVDLRSRFENCRPVENKIILDLSNYSFTFKVFTFLLFLIKFIRFAVLYMLIIIF